MLDFVDVDDDANPPIYVCSDHDVRSFCAAEMWDFNPFRVQLSAQDLINACIGKFGLGKCVDFYLKIH